MPSSSMSSAQYNDSNTLMIILGVTLLCMSANALDRPSLQRAGEAGLPTWEVPKLPEISHVTVLQQDKAYFHGKVPRSLNITCDLECQKRRTTQPSNIKQLLEELKFETLDMNSSLSTRSSVEVSYVPRELFLTTPNVVEVANKPGKSFSYEEYFPGRKKSLVRKKRSIFGPDTRFTLSPKKFIFMYPFSTAVKLTTGCSGVLLSPKHVLTSAHCIHDGKRYVKGVRKLKAGKMVLNAQRKNKKKRKTEKKQRSKKMKKVFKTRARRGLPEQDGNVQPQFKWVRARKTYLPQGWLSAAKGGTESQSKTSQYPVEYDYAVIELKKSLGKHYMDLGIYPQHKKIPSSQRIHFTGFDSDRPDDLLYRFCTIEDETPDLLYHFCDAQEGTSGSGIYIRLYDSQKNLWSRKVIAIFSGHQFVTSPDGTSKKYNTGVRITPLKYAQICFWTKGSYEECRGG